MQQLENPMHTFGRNHGDGSDDAGEAYDPRARIARDGLQATLERLLGEARDEASAALRECTCGDQGEFYGCWEHDTEAALDACAADRAQAKKTKTGGGK